VVVFTAKIKFIKYSVKILLLCFLTLYLYSCVKINKSNKIEILNSGYNTEKVFVYSIALDNKIVDTIALYCTSIISKEFNNQYLSQWVFLKYSNNQHWYIDSTRGKNEEGIFFNDTTIFIHPPRFLYLKQTQFLPYPYFKNAKKWHWDFEIGKIWEIPSLYTIDSTVLFHIDYNMRIIEPDTYFINSISKSEFGISVAEFTVNSNLGFVKIKYKTQLNHIIQFDLIKNTNQEQLWEINKELKQRTVKDKEKKYIYFK
jgi:hypothetical protein